MAIKRGNQIQPRQHLQRAHQNECAEDHCCKASLHPRPNGTNLNKLEGDLVEKLRSVPSYQSTDEGYDGMVDDPTMYALQCPRGWVAWPDPGPHQVVDPALNTAVQADALVQYNFKSSAYELNKNIKTAVISILSLLVPSTYQRITGGRRWQIYQTTDDPKGNNLRTVAFI